MASMDFDAYQDFTDTTATYPDQGNNLMYPTLGLTEEAGEVAGKLAKTIRDKNGIFDTETRLAIAKELGDVLWFMARLARELGVPLSKVAELNMLKLRSRQLRNRISGNGDDR